MTKFTLISLMLLLSLTHCHQSDNERLEVIWSSIKRDPDRLEAFIKDLPKGGDLHHHLLGSVYAETFLDLAMNQTMWIDTNTFQLHLDSTGSASVISVNQAKIWVPDFENRAVDAWSIRNLDTLTTTGHDQFFSTFFKFQPAFVGNELIALNEVCRRGKQNGLQYIETSFLHWDVQDDLTLLSRGLSTDSKVTAELLMSWTDTMMSRRIDTISERSFQFYDDLHEKIEDCGLTIGFQTYGNRCLPDQSIVYAQLLHGFQVASESESVVGVNLVAPEDFKIALDHFDDHMLMFQFLHERYPNVSISLHAGELVPGLGDVEQEDLLSHIYTSIEIAGADRIGHGVDLSYESNSTNILNQMKERDICVELNLESNQVILGIGKDQHPIHVYREQGVPMVISTDDEGVLRSDINKQYQLLIEYVPDLSFDELKTLVFNSVHYSFLPHEKKKVVVEQLSHDFQQLEQTLLN